MKYLWRILLPCVLLLSSLSCSNPTDIDEASNDYKFTLTSVSNTSSVIKLGETAKFYFHLKNNGPSDDVYDLLVTTDYPDTTWVTYLCCQELCLRDTFAIDSLASGEQDTNVSVYIETNKNTIGTGWATLRATSQGDPSKVLEYKVWARTKPDDEIDPAK